MVAPRKNATLAEGNQATATAVGLAYHDSMPLGFRPLAALPDEAELLRINNENQQILALDAALEERHPVDPKDDDAVMRHELERLESKLNIIMQLLSRLLSRENAAPIERKFRLAADGIAWDHDVPLALESIGVVHCTSIAHCHTRSNWWDASLPASRQAPFIASLSHSKAWRPMSSNFSRR